MNPTTAPKQTEQTRLKIALFSEKSKEVPVSAADTVKFLSLAAKSRRYLTHYTELGALKGILAGERIWLTRVDLLNDLKEFSKADLQRKARTYIVSFAATRRESVAMWWMYGLAGQETKTGRIPVQLVFPMRAIRNSLDNMRDDVRMVVEETNERGEKKKKVKMEGKPLDVIVLAMDNRTIGVKGWRVSPCAAVPGGDRPPTDWYVIIHGHHNKKLKLFDVLYLSSMPGQELEVGKGPSGRIYWNTEQAHCSRCAGGDIRAFRELDGYIKDAGWAYEGETRIAVELSRKVDCSQIAIPFKLPMDELEIRVGPGRFDKTWLDKVKKARCTMRGNQSFRIGDKLKVSKSLYDVHFRKDRTRDEQKQEQTS